MFRFDALQLQPDRRLAFLRGFLRNPAEVGSLVPSSRYLERLIVAQAGVADARSVVELGPGTGGTTRQILRAMRPDATLLAIELDPEFAELVSDHRDPRLLVHVGSAERIAQAIAAHGLSAPQAVISGIPFSTMPAEVGRAIVESVREVLAPGGVFVAYQFRDAVARLATPILGAPEVHWEVRNVPPMRVYRWRVA